MIPGFRARALALLVGTWLLLATAGAGAQSAVDASADARTVVAAWSISGDTARPDPSVGMAADRRAAFDAVEVYVWSALPPDAKARVSRLELFVVPGSVENASDGTAAENDDGTTWTLGLDDGEAESAVLGGDVSDEGTFDEVVAHEVGHVLSLNKDQRADRGTAGTYADDEGAFAASSYLNRFYQRFWKGHYADWSADADEDQSSRVYDRHPDSFVTEYAATDPSEDFAESFAYFVLGRRTTSQTERGEKIRFFYGFPDLVKDRDAMRASLSSVR